MLCHMAGHFPCPVIWQDTLSVRYRIQYNSVYLLYISEYPWDTWVYLEASSGFQVVRILREYAFLWLYADLYGYKSAYTTEKTKKCKFPWNPDNLKSWASLQVYSNSPRICRIYTEKVRYSVSNTWGILPYDRAWKMARPYDRAWNMPMENAYIPAYTRYLSIYTWYIPVFIWYIGVYLVYSDIYPNIPWIPGKM